MSGYDELDMLAAEYVLGTLDAGERASVEARRGTEPALEELIRHWEILLAPLNDQVVSVEPAPDLLSRIDRRLDELSSHGQTDTVTAHRTEETGNVVSMRQRLRRWQLSSVVAGVAALVLLSVLIWRPTPEPQPFVAVFQQDDRQPAFLLSVNLQTREVTLRPVTAQPLEDQSYQLWIKADPLGPSPQSVAVLDSDLSVASDALRSFDSRLLEQATFGISIEPKGGSPTGQPTGPAIHGYLYPTGEGPGQQQL